MTAGWEWRLSDTARSEFEGLDSEGRERIETKLDAVVTDEWRDPGDYLAPLQGVPHSKLRVGSYRLGCRLDRQQRVLFVERITKRGGDAYRDDDD